MRFIFKISILVLLALNSCSPKLNKFNIKSELEKFYKTHDKGDIEGILDFEPMETWKILNKDTLANQLRNLYKYDKTLRKYEGITELAVYDRIECEKRYLYYCTYYINEINSSNYIDEATLQNNYLSYGKENVKLDSINKKIIVREKESVILIYENQTKSWKIIKGNFGNLDKLFGVHFENCVLKKIKYYQ